MSIIEEKDFEVTLTFTLSTRVAFSPMERDTPITAIDAIANAVGSMPGDVFDALMDGFGGEFMPARLATSCKELT